AGRGGGATPDAPALAAGVGGGGAKYAWYMYSTRNDSRIAIKTRRSIRQSRARHRIGAVASQRVAASKPPHAEPDAFGRTVDLDCFAHVVGARRIEAAGTCK